MMIILSAAEADLVRGESAPGHVLAPCALVDGNFALAERVLSDPAHALHLPLLLSLPRRDVSAQEWLRESDGEDDA